MPTHFCGVEDGGYEWQDETGCCCGSRMWHGASGSGTASLPLIWTQAHNCFTNQWPADVKEKLWPTPWDNTRRLIFASQAALGRYPETEWAAAGWGRLGLATAAGWPQLPRWEAPWAAASPERNRGSVGTSAGRRTARSSRCVWCMSRWPSGSDLVAQEKQSLIHSKEWNINMAALRGDFMDYVDINQGVSYNNDFTSFWVFMIKETHDFWFLIPFLRKLS